MKLRHMEIVTDKDKLSVDIQQTVMKYKTIKQWAYILHDQDDTRPHYHIYLNFHPSSADTKDVAKWFQLGYTDDKGVEHSGEQFIEKVKGRKTDVLLYLIHGNDSQKFKHQYSPDEVVSNFDFESEIATAKIIGDFENHSYAQMLQYINTLPISEKAKAYTLLEKLWKIHCQTLTLQTDRELEVVFIQGKPGTGKTYYAKKMLTSLGYDFAISSSSNDPFQDYLGQKAIILDDFRDKDGSYDDGGFSFADFLKIIDNNTMSSVKSRFTNKVFNGKMIVITTPKPLCYWYTQQRMAQDDGLKQLYRRIGLYVIVERDTIFLYNQIDDNGKPTGVPQRFKNEIPELIKKTVKKTDFGAVFASICETETYLPTPTAVPISMEQEELPF